MDPTDEHSARWRPESLALVNARRALVDRSHEVCLSLIGRPLQSEEQRECESERGEQAVIVDAQGPPRGVRAVPLTRSHMEKPTARPMRPIRNVANSVRSHSAVSGLISSVVSPAVASPKRKALQITRLRDAPRRRAVAASPSGGASLSAWPRGVWASADPDTGDRS